MNVLLISVISILIGMSPAVVGALHAADIAPAISNSITTPLSAQDQQRYDQAMNLIQTFSGTGDHLERASKTLIDLAQQYPQSGYPVAGLAELSYRRATMGGGALQEAFTLAQRAIKLDPNVAEAYIVVAKVMIEQNNLFAARQAADKAIALAPGKPEAMFVKGRVAERSTQYAEAEDWYRNAINQFTDNQRKSNMYIRLAEMFKNKKPQDIPAAVQAYEKAIELDAYSPWKLNNAGVFLICCTERYDQAIDYFNRALNVMSFGAARTNLGLAQFFKWGDAQANPGKYKDAKQKPEDPKTITDKTGVTAEYAFVQNAVGSRTPSATIAMLKTGMIKNVDVVPTGSRGTALTAAAYGNHLDVVKMLVERGANINAEDIENRSTAIFYAVANQNSEMVKYLVEKGARINVVDGHRRPLVARALDNSMSEDISVLGYLLEKGADPSIPDQNGNVLIVNAVRRGNPAAVNLLLDKYGADPDTAGGGIPVLASAAVSSGTQSRIIVKKLLTAGANPWVYYGSRDVLFTLSASHINATMFPSFKDNLGMILEARKSKPKPQDFKAFPDG